MVIFIGSFLEQASATYTRLKVKDSKVLPSWKINSIVTVSMMSTKVVSLLLRTKNCQFQVDRGKSFCVVVRRHGQLGLISKL